MSRCDRFLILLEDPALFAIVANALDDYRAMLVDHCDTFAGRPEAEYFARSVDHVDDLRMALWE